MIITFWITFALIVYTFVGYGALLFLLVRLRRMLRGKRPLPLIENLPSCTLVIAAYNEELFIREKIANTLELDYESGKLESLFITDGSSDNTPDIISEYPQIRLMHRTERLGKVAAMHRAFDTLSSEIVIFTDANTILNKQALVNIARHYSDKTIGAVAGEKRIRVEESADAGTAGEGFYWKYESALKKWDSELNTVVGAAGELFSVRRELYKPVPDDTILDDFMISMLIAQQKYRIVYEPESYALEYASHNIKEELKRKIRIAAGGIQSIMRLLPLLNIFKYGLLSFQYISHRVLRWTIVPFLLIILVILNIQLVVERIHPIYWSLLFGQVLFYAAAVAGMALENRQMRIKVFFIPYYFCVMNYAVIRGIGRYLSNRQSAVWEKAIRKSGNN
ncbi:glycosyltransferase family 2 protein [Daejeonella lutea]|uniref:Glycosyltransferase, catalytic subunit of cellulose synthase and poly-beta-1,6-N-acetylglucosamine synthase n=1 Tax=Daejeonella lutea TaxID=572036 RepID=A0A1T5EEK5_9SPHI|nr:glycosyltransferase family 2 protein [Daejeonella lutea]SKB82195.1 Glycosyltransferase, catalytic subunit of cellulose synthase and poly-beta-1,6-N-acetylglucosamine synthase [Daejeonella lutea]